MFSSSYSVSITIWLGISTFSFSIIISWLGSSTSKSLNTSSYFCSTFKPNSASSIFCFVSSVIIFPVSKSVIVNFAFLSNKLCYVSLLIIVFVYFKLASLFTISSLL